MFHALLKHYRSVAHANVMDNVLHKLCGCAFNHNSINFSKDFDWQRAVGVHFRTDLTETLVKIWDVFSVLQN